MGEILGIPAAASYFYDVINHSWQNQAEGIALWRQGHEKWRHKAQSSSEGSSFILKIVMVTTTSTFLFIVLGEKSSVSLDIYLF